MQTSKFFSILTIHFWRLWFFKRKENAELVLQSCLHSHLSRRVLQKEAMNWAELWRGEDNWARHGSCYVNFALHARSDSTPTLCSFLSILISLCGTSRLASHHEKQGEALTENKDTLEKGFVTNQIARICWLAVYGPLDVQNCCCQAEKHLRHFRDNRDYRWMPVL